MYSLDLIRVIKFVNYMIHSRHGLGQNKDKNKDLKTHRI